MADFQLILSILIVYDELTFLSCKSLKELVQVNTVGDDSLPNYVQFLFSLLLIVIELLQ